MPTPKCVSDPAAAVLVLFALLALCLGCAGRQAPAADAAVTYAFRAVDRDVSSSGAVTEHLVGTAYVYPDQIRVVVQSGFALFQRTPTRRPTGVSAGIAFCHTRGRWAGHWGFAKQSSILPISRIQARADTLAAPMEFVIRGTRDLDLAEHWITIQQHSHLFVQTTGGWHEATNPIHSEPYVFDPARAALPTAPSRRCNEDR